ncbi:RloB family protein [Planktothrix agardhii]|uniref:RloB family protein n=1 Tax=Planktothrix agardhii TaxID=1160 RepID=UPI001D09EE4E|nr:RloB family protein [Planktothrix agardhii]MCB8786733.1 RloB family protein [Planktothrix agardhii 1025]MCF3611625.1 RloB family protein [Planktothrix agardhii 1027]MCF3645379.1 RloB family protein [Planktothrix agardhii 1026]
MPRERKDYQRIVQDISDECKDGKWKIYVIAAEGDKTEYLYFQELIQQYSLQLNKKNIKLKYLDKTNSGDSDPAAVYAQLKQCYDELVKKYDIQEYDELWMIIDTDYYRNRKDKIEELIKLFPEKINFKMGLSNPCFELWLILHFVDTDSQVDADSQFAKGNNPKKCKTNKKRKVKEPTQPTIREVIENEGIKGRPKLCKKVLSDIHPDKSKSNYYKEFIKGEYLVAAIERARKLGECQPTDEDFPQRIGTTVYKLLEQFLELFGQLD